MEATARPEVALDLGQVWVVALRVVVLVVIVVAIVIVVVLVELH